MKTLPNFKRLSSAGSWEAMQFIERHACFRVCFDDELGESQHKANREKHIRHECEAIRRRRRKVGWENEHFECILRLACVCRQYFVHFAGFFSLPRRVEMMRSRYYSRFNSMLSRMKMRRFFYRRLFSRCWLGKQIQTDYCATSRSNKVFKAIWTLVSFLWLLRFADQRRRKILDEGQTTLFVMKKKNHELMTCAINCCAH